MRDRPPVEGSGDTGLIQSDEFKTILKAVVVACAVELREIQPPLHGRPGNVFQLCPNPIFRRHPILGPVQWFGKAEKLMMFFQKGQDRGIASRLITEKDRVLEGHHRVFCKIERTGPNGFGEIPDMIFSRQKPAKYQKFVVGPRHGSQFLPVVIAYTTDTVDFCASGIGQVTHGITKLMPFHLAFYLGVFGCQVSLPGGGVGNADIRPQKIFFLNQDLHILTPRQRGQNR